MVYEFQFLDVGHERIGQFGAFYFRVDKLLRELANPNLHDIAKPGQSVLPGRDQRGNASRC